jgi:hypothetical protein
MAVIIKRKVTPAKVSGGPKVETSGKAETTPSKKETGDKSYGPVGKEDSSSPERKAMNYAIVKARSEGNKTGPAESGKYKGKEYDASAKSYDIKRKVTSDLKVEPPTAKFEIKTKKTSPPPSLTKPGREKSGKDYGKRENTMKFDKKGKPEKAYYKTSKRLKMMKATKRYH